MELSQVVMIIFIILIAFWRRDIFLYFMAAPVSLATGLAWRGYYDNPLGISISLVLIGIGVYCLVVGIYNVVLKRG